MLYNLLISLVRTILNHARIAFQTLQLEPAQHRLVSYLPLANMAVQMFDIWISIASITTVYYGRSGSFQQVCEGNIL